MQLCHYCPSDNCVSVLRAISEGVSARGDIQRSRLESRRGLSDDVFDIDVLNETLDSDTLQRVEGTAPASDIWKAELADRQSYFNCPECGGY
jgi:hypothetical protein